MKRIILIVTAAGMLFVSGCSGTTILSNYREVEDLELVRTVGVDLYETGGVTLTVGTASSASDPPRFYQSSGASIAAVVNEMQRLPLGKEALFSHTAHFVFSEKAASKGLDGYLDYIERSPDMRLDTYLFIARGGTVSDLMTGVTGKKSGVSEELSFLADNMANLGSGYAFTCREVAAGLCEGGVALIQAVNTKEHKVLFEGQAERALMPDGFAVIKDGRLVTFLNGQQSFGAALLLNKVKSRTMTATADGCELTLTVNKAKADYTPEFSSSGEIEKVKAVITLDANIISVDGGALISRRDIRDAAMRSLSEQVKEAASAALEASATLNADFLQLQKSLSLKSPKKLAALEDRWDTLYPEIDFELEAEINLSRTYDIEDPLNVSGEEIKTIWNTEIK